MRGFLVSTWGAGIAAVGWCALAAIWLSPYRDPLIGYGPVGYFKAMSLQVVFALLFMLLAHYKRRWLAGILGILAILLALPLPSKAGALIRVENRTPLPADVMLSRGDDSKRRVLLSVPMGQTTKYRTAPGEYPEGLQVVLENGTSRLTTTVIELRRCKVVLSETNLWLTEAIQK